MRSKIIWLSLIASLSLWGWERNGSPVCQAEGGQGNIRATALNGGRIAILWEDGRAGHPNYTLYMQVMDSTGQPLLQKDGIMIPDTFHQRKPQIATDGEYVYIVYEDYRGGFEDGNIYLTKINGFTGEKIGGDIPICTADGNQYDPRLCLSSEGGVWVCWQDYRSGDADVYIAKISPEGEKVFEVPVCSLPGGQGTPMAVPSGEGCIIFWGDSRDSLPGVYGQRITGDSPSGQWGANGKLIIPFPQGAYSQNLALSPERGYFFPYAISDEREGSILHDVFITGTWQRVDSLGNLLWEPPPDVPSPYHIVPNGASGVIGCFGSYRDESHPYSRVFAVQIDSSAKPIWEKLLIWQSPYYDTTTYITYPTLTDDSYQGAVLTWVQDDYTGNKLLITRADSSGEVVWNPPHIISDSPYEKAHPFVIKGPDNGYIVVYEENHPNTGWDIMGIYVDSTGEKGIEERDGRWKMLDNRILSAVPNPFGEFVVISYQLSVKASVSLKVYDAMGKLVRILTSPQTLKPGVYNVRWDGRDSFGKKLPSGIYFYQLEIGRKRSLTDKVILIRKEGL